MVQVVRSAEGGDVPQRTKKCNFAMVKGKVKGKSQEPASQQGRTSHSSEGGFLPMPTTGRAWNNE